jgi:hypothetical protein
MKEFSFLLPRGFRSLGFVFICLGAVLGFIRFYFGYKPEFLNRKVFALISSYLDNKFFEVIGNQLLEEVSAILLLSGLFLVAFSKEKIENRINDSYRLKAFFVSVYFTAIFLLLTIIFTYGMGFVYAAILGMGLWIIVYYISFKIIFYQSKNN